MICRKYMTNFAMLGAGRWYLGIWWAFRLWKLQESLRAHHAPMQQLLHSPDWPWACRCFQSCGWKISCALVCLVAFAWQGLFLSWYKFRCWNLELVGDTGYNLSTMWSAEIIRNPRKGPLVPALWLSLSPEEDTLAATDNVLMAFVFGIQKGRFPLTISMRACTKENPQRER